MVVHTVGVCHFRGSPSNVVILTQDVTGVKNKLVNF